VVEADPAAEDVHTAEADPEPGPEAVGDPEGQEVEPGAGLEVLPTNENDHTLEAEVQADQGVEAGGGLTPGHVQGSAKKRM
jgi:hypothetical protein